MAYIKKPTQSLQIFYILLAIASLAELNWALLSATFILIFDSIRHSLVSYYTY